MNSYLSPLVSCLVCKEVKSSKGIFSHIIAAHGSEERKKQFTGKGVNRLEKSNIIRKQKYFLKNLIKWKEYYSNPRICHCGNPHDWFTRNNKACSHSCGATLGSRTRSESGWTMSLDTRNLLRLRNKGKPAKNKKLEHSPVYQCVICKNFFPGNRKVCDNKNCRYENIKGRVGGYRINSTKNTRTFYNGTQFDSGSEATFAKLLDSHSIKWEKNISKKFTYIDISENTRNYIPDFYLPEYDQWIEIKGKYYYDEVNDNLKWKYFRETHKNSLEIIWSNDIKLPAVCTSHDLVLED